LTITNEESMIKQLGIVGVGTMGTGIAELALLSKIPVQLYDINETILRRSIERIKGNLRKMVNLGKLPTEEFSASMERIRTRTSLPDLGGCDCIIESIIEDIRVKKDLFKHLDANTKSTALLASTTDSLSITSIASLTKNPERVLGLHFFNPVNTTSLVEVVKGHTTNDETIAQAKDFIAALAKTAILVKDTPGFIVSRISQPMYDEALRLITEHVATPEQIDTILKLIGGFPLGPLEAIDQMGVDIAINVSETLYARSYGDARFRPSPLLKHMTESGTLGKKSGKGFYAYTETNGK
jgi:3-hydroxybutyryl-CoA dehydrogenase